MIGMSLEFVVFLEANSLIANGYLLLMNLLKKNEEGKFSYLIPRVATTSTKNLSNILASALPSVTRPLSSTGTI